MPILNYDSLDVVPAELREFAKPVENGEGKVTVNVVSKTAIDEFRDNNIKLTKERDLLRTELDPLKAIVGENHEEFNTRLTELTQIAQRVKDGELKESRGIEEALHKRTEELRKDYDTRLQSEGKEKAAWRQKYDALEVKHKQTMVVSAIKDAAMESDSGVEPRAISEITMSALQVFKCDDHGRIIPYEGDAPIYGSDGTSAMTPREWLARLKEDKPFFFKPSAGGGSGGDGNGGKKVLGRSQQDVKGMTALQRLALANGETPRK